MTIEFIEQEFLKFYKGNRELHSHIEALHAVPPKADLLTDKIVEKTLEKINCSGIISKVSRKEADLNRKPDGQNNEALAQYQNIINEILQYQGIIDMKINQLTKPYLHLSVHGMKDVYHGPYGIEIGTCNGKSCSKRMEDWFLETITNKRNEFLPKINILLNEKFDGDQSIIFHRCGDGKTYSGYGEHFHTFQVEIARTLRAQP